MNTVSRFDPQRPAQNNRDLLKLRLLCRFFPATRRDHSGDANVLVARRDSSDKFFDAIGLVTSSDNNFGFFNKSAHNDSALVEILARSLYGAPTRLLAPPA